MVGSLVWLECLIKRIARISNVLRGERIVVMVYGDDDEVFRKKKRKKEEEIVRLIGFLFET